MGTTQPDDTEKVHGVIRTAQGVIEVVEDIAYGDTKTKRSLYPLVLLLVAAIALSAVLLVDAEVLGLVGLASLVLLALWVGGSGR